MPRPITFLDVFADRPLAGNGLAVVGEADGVSDEVMLAFARETRLSETTFVQSAQAEGADYRNRIWTPGEEMVLAGHPTLGTGVAVARWHGASGARFTQETPAGLQPVEVERREHGEKGAERWWASMIQGAPQFGPELAPDATMRAAGLGAADAHPDLPPQVVSIGITHVMAPLGEAEALARVRPDYEAIDRLLRAHDAVVLYVAWCEPELGRARARGFARIVEVGEDPATGSAAGPLCAYLAERADCRAVTISQGEEMGRPSTLETEIEEGRVRVSGSVIPVLDGEVRLPGENRDTAADA